MCYDDESEGTVSREAWPDGNTYKERTNGARGKTTDGQEEGGMRGKEKGEPDGQDMSGFGFSGRYFIIHARHQQSQFHLAAEYLTLRTVWQYHRQIYYPGSYCFAFSFHPAFIRTITLCIIEQILSSLFRNSTFVTLSMRLFLTGYGATDHVLIELDIVSHDADGVRSNSARAERSGRPEHRRRRVRIDRVQLTLYRIGYQHRHTVVLKFKILLTVWLGGAIVAGCTLESIPIGMR
jgi:hypothetical protein